MATAEIKAKISLNTSALSAGLKIAETQASKAASKMGEAFKEVGKHAAVIGLALAGLKLHHLIKATAEALDFKGALEKAGFSLQKVKDKLSDFAQGTIDSLRPALTNIFGALDSINFYQIGAKLGDSLQSALNLVTNAFAENKLGDLILLTVGDGALRAADFLLAAFNGALEGVTEMIRQTFAALVSPDFWSGMVNAFVAAVNTMASMGLGILDGFYKFQKAQFDYLVEKLKGGSKTFGDVLQGEQGIPGLGAARKDLDQNASEASTRASNSFGQSPLDAGKIMEAFNRGFADKTLLGDQVEKTDSALKNLVDSINTTSKQIQETTKQGYANYFQVDDAKKEYLNGFSQRVQAASSLERVGAIIPGQHQGIDYAQRSSNSLLNIDKGIQRLQKLMEKNNIPTGGNSMIGVYAS